MNILHDQSLFDRALFHVAARQGWIPMFEESVAVAWREMVARDLLGEEIEELRARGSRAALDAADRLEATYRAANNRFMIRYEALQIVFAEMHHIGKGSKS